MHPAAATLVATAPGLNACPECGPGNAPAPQAAQTLLKPRLEGARQATQPGGGGDGGGSEDSCGDGADDADGLSPTNGLLSTRLEPPQTRRNSTNKPAPRGTPPCTPYETADASC